jgi:hypothetical protein
MVIGKWISQALGTVVEIGVPEQLAKGARRCSDIAREANVSEDGMYRLLRALASLGLFVESADRRFKLTGMGKLLRSDHPESLAGYARFVAHDSTWRPWGQLGYSVKERHAGVRSCIQPSNIRTPLAESRSRRSLTIHQLRAVAFAELGHSPNGQIPVCLMRFPQWLSE